MCHLKTAMSGKFDIKILVVSPKQLHRLHQSPMQ